ncbi:unnamed protein product [Miscanthus lutarioriparius]|uniref:Ubiquitinyl hydrolase 1 n=1 Tax=Miscanthus lutarioriparius TaxID=422564 RepID=A0A811MIU1_9POAL|nr:unnamed protein product [Miscanthus lutarioriparius]
MLQLGLSKVEKKVHMAGIIRHYKLLEMVAEQGVEFHSTVLNLCRAYSEFRPVHGDGECFYRSFIFSLIKFFIGRIHMRNTVFFLVLLCFGYRSPLCSHEPTAHSGTLLLTGISCTDKCYVGQLLSSDDGSKLKMLLLNRGYPRYLPSSLTRSLGRKLELVAPSIPSDLQETTEDMRTSGEALAFIGFEEQDTVKL